MVLAGSLPRLFARASQAAAQKIARPGPPNLRALRDEHVSSARERIFGPQGSMPGDRYLRKKLEGRELMRWYFPSKYTLQDFRIDEYFEMQAERFAPREGHRCMPALNVVTQKVASNREQLRKFFNTLDEETFFQSPSLQDLYGVFRLVDGDHALSFPVPESIFVEHSPMFGAAPLFSLTAGSSQPSTSQPGMNAELKALWALLQDKLKSSGPDGDSLALALDARIAQLQSEEDMRALLLETAHENGLVAPFEQLSVVMEDAAQGGAVLAKKVASQAASDDANLDEGSAADIDAAETAEDKAASDDANLDEGSAADMDAAEMAEDEASATEIMASEKQPTARKVLQAGRKGIAMYLARPQHGGSPEDRAAAKARAEQELESMRKEGPVPVRKYLERRHRFIDPMFRRRRLKWLERQMAGKNKETEVKFNTYYATHPDQHTEWPTNKGSVTVKYPSPYH